MNVGFFDALVQANHRYGDELTPVQRAHGLTRAELDVLLFLANNPAFGTAAQVVRVRRLAKSHVSLAVSSLVRRGFLRKEKRQGNQKTEYLEITPAARQAVTDGQAAQKRFWDALFRGFTPKEQERFIKDARRMGENIKQEHAKEGIEG